MLTTAGRHGHRAGRRGVARRARAPARRPAGRLRTPGRAQLCFAPASPRTSVKQVATIIEQAYRCFVECDAMLVEVNPLIVTHRRRGQGARLQVHGRRQRAVPPPRHRRDARRGRGRPAGADGARAGRHVRQARRRRRHPRQRRRARDVDAGRGRAGRRHARQLPRRGRRRAGRRDRRRRSRSSSPTTRSRRSSSTSSAASRAATRSRAASSTALDQIDVEVPIVVRLDGTSDVEGRRILAEAQPAQPARRARRCWTPRERAVELAGARPPDGRHRHRRDAAGRAGHHRPRGLVPRAAQPRLRHAGRRRRDAGQGRPGRRRHPGLRHRRTTPSTTSGANTSMVFVPPRFAADAIYEAVDAGVDTVDLHHRGHPGARHAARLRLRARARRDAARPELPGRAARRAMANVGIIPAHVFTRRARSGWSRAPAR